MASWALQVIQTTNAGLLQSKQIVGRMNSVIYTVNQSGRFAQLRVQCCQVLIERMSLSFKSMLFCDAATGAAFVFKSMDSVVSALFSFLIRSSTSFRREAMSTEDSFFKVASRVCSTSAPRRRPGSHDWTNLPSSASPEFPH